MGLRKGEKKMGKNDGVRHEYDAVVDGGDRWKVIDESGNVYMYDLSYEDAIDVCERWNEQEYE